MSDSPKGRQEGDASEKLTLGRVGSFLKSAWSKGANETKTDEKTKRLRVISCHGDSSLGLDSPCEWRRESIHSDGIYYCGLCGCGDKPKSWLNGPEDAYTKLDYPTVVCPMQMPGFTNHTPYGQETEEIAKKNQSPRKMNIEFTLFSKGIDTEHRGEVANPDAEIKIKETVVGNIEQIPHKSNKEKVNNPEIPKSGCSKCGRKAKPKKCKGCGGNNIVDPNQPPPRGVMPQERIKNNIDDVPFG